MCTYHRLDVCELDGRVRRRELRQGVRLGVDEHEEGVAGALVVARADLEAEAREVRVQRGEVRVQRAIFARGRREARVQRRGVAVRHDAPREQRLHERRAHHHGRAQRPSAETRRTRGRAKMRRRARLGGRHPTTAMADVSSKSRLPRAR